VAFVVALYKLNTQTCQHLSVKDRLKGVRQAVEKTQYWTAKWKNGLDGDELHAIFLAPEYCFARSTGGAGDHSFGTRRQMSESVVDAKLRPTFGGLSQGFRNALIVPGTVAWRKSLLPAQGSRGRSPEEVETARRDKYARRIEDAARINLWDPVIGPGNTVVGNGNFPFTAGTRVFPERFKRPDDPRGWGETAGFKAHVMRTTARYLAKNTAHCYYNGADPVYKYNKIGDFYEVFQPVRWEKMRTVEVPNRDRSEVTGTTSGAGRFRVPGLGLDFGIGICYDQSLSVQNNAVTAVEPLQRTAGPVDFHLLLSAHIPPNLAAANLKNGGYLLSCSSQGECNKVIRSDGVVMAPRRATKAGTESLDLYLLPETYNA
jgi:hypothetical protein